MPKPENTALMFASTWCRACERFQPLRIDAAPDNPTLELLVCDGCGRLLAAVPIASRSDPRDSASQP